MRNRAFAPKDNLTRRVPCPSLECVVNCSLTSCLLDIQGSRNYYRGNIGERGQTSWARLSRLGLLTEARDSVGVDGVGVHAEASSSVVRWMASRSARRREVDETRARRPKKTPVRSRAPSRAGRWCGRRPSRGPSAGELACSRPSWLAFRRDIWRVRVLRFLSTLALAAPARRGHLGPRSLRRSHGLMIDGPPTRPFRTQSTTQHVPPPIVTLPLRPSPSASSPTARIFSATTPVSAT